MIRFIVLLLFVLTLAVTPVYLLEHSVMPQLLNLKDFYANSDAMATKIAAPRP